MSAAFLSQNERSTKPDERTLRRTAGSVSLATLLGAPLLDAIRELVREELNATLAGTSEEWIPHPRWPFGSRRRNAELARSGRIEGVRREGKLWLARRSALDAFLAACHAPVLPNANGDNDLDAEVEALVARRARG